MLTFLAATVEEAEMVGVVIPIVTVPLAAVTLGVTTWGVERDFLIKICPEYAPIPGTGEEILAGVTGAVTLVATTDLATTWEGDFLIIDGVADPEEATGFTTGIPEVRLEEDPVFDGDEVTGVSLMEESLDF